MRRPEFDDGTPRSARVYDYLLGGKDHFAVDRQLAEVCAREIPSLREMAGHNRRFVARASTFLAARGIDQFLDLGTGIPIAPHLHDIVQQVTPSARVVYVDNDPVVLAHARALMVGSPEGALAFVEGDLRDPRLLAVPPLGRVIDRARPVGVMVTAVLMLLDDPFGAMADLRAAMPSGSYLALTHPTADFDPAAVAAATAHVHEAGMTFRPRGRAAVARFFGDWELVAPGLVPVAAWRGDDAPEDPVSAYYWAGVARKP